MRNFEKYCKDYENIENYEKAKADDFKGWHCHHMLETHTSDGERRPFDIAVEELIALDIYYNRPHNELIFLKASEHKSLHFKGKTYFKGKCHTEETKKKISEANKGNMANRGKKFSDKHKKKISEANKGKYISEETRKKNSEASTERNTGRHWYNNGQINKFCYECPQGFVPGKLLH